jgi:hypothetical protein
MERTVGNRVGKMERTVGNRVGKMERTVGNRVGKMERTVGNRVGRMERTVGRTAQHTHNIQLKLVIPKYIIDQKKYFVNIFLNYQTLL